jgi:hypothetical protein
MGLKDVLGKVIEKGRDGLVSFQLNQKFSDLEKISGKKLFEQTGLILKRGEILLYCQSADFFEERAIRVYNAGHYGVRITKGFWIGGTKGHSESHGEMRKIDTGVLSVTSDRFLFNGKLKNHSIPIKKINHVQPYKREIEVGSDTRQKVLVFSTDVPQQLAYKIKCCVNPDENEEQTQQLLLAELFQKVLSYIKAIEFSGTMNEANFQKYVAIVQKASDFMAKDVEDYDIGNVSKNKLFQSAEAISKQLKIYTKKCEEISKDKSSFNGNQKGVVLKLTTEFSKIQEKMNQIGKL